jgi:hypothetical protein
MLPVGENGPFTLAVPPPDVLTGVVVVIGVVEAVEAGDVGELPPHPTICEAAQSRSNIENFRMVCLLNPLQQLGLSESLECWGRYALKRNFDRESDNVIWISSLVREAGRRNGSWSESFGASEVRERAMGKE